MLLEKTAGVLAIIQWVALARCRIKFLEKETTPEDPETRVFLLYTFVIFATWQ